MITRADRARAAQVFTGLLPKGWQTWIEEGGPITCPRVEMSLDRLAAEFANHREATLKEAGRG